MGLAKISQPYNFPVCVSSIYIRVIKSVFVVYNI